MTSLAAALLVLFASLDAFAASCTDGTDCYCDKVAVGGSLEDTDLIWCEDFEAATLHDDVDFGVTTGTFGPWYDDTGITGARGNNSYWFQTYTEVISACVWKSPDPVTPTVGTACGFSSCMLGEFRADDLWQANTFACVDIVQNGEFDDDQAGNAELTGNSDGMAGAWDGKQSYGARVPTGRTVGLNGGPTFTGVTTLGLTMAFGYASNVADSGVLAHPWKHDEIGFSQQHWNLGLVGTAGTAQYPYSPIMFHTGESACNTALTAATKNVGSFLCNDGALEMGAEATEYVQATDFPWGTWGCHQAYITGMGGGSTEIKIWHDEVLVIHLSDWDGTVFVDQSFDRYKWDHYANANQDPGCSSTCETPTTENTARYQDNMHLREGLPVSCAQIGWGTGSSTSPSQGIGFPSGGGISLLRRALFPFFYAGILGVTR